MQKKIFRLTDRQLEKLRKESNVLGIPLTELVRRILDEHIDKIEKERLG